MRHTRTFARFSTAVAVPSLEESSAAVLRAEPYPDAFPLTANRPLRLDDPAQLWIVVSGEVDLFHVLGSGDTYLAHRRYVGTLSAGEVVAGARPVPETGDGVLIAVGFGGARLHAVPRAAIDEAAGDGRIARALANGLAETMGRAMYRSSRSSARPVDLSERRLSLDAGTAITALADVMWFQLDDGELALGGDVPVAPSPLYLPLARGMWFTAGSDGTALVVVDTFTAFAERSIGAALVRAWGIFIAWLAAQADKDDAAERARLERRVEGERAKHASALASLAGLLQGRGGAQPAEPQGDPLLDACGMIGTACGIAFRAPPVANGRPPAAGDAADPHRDLVMRICAASRVRYRRVTLRDGWWESDAGPILGFRARDFAPVALLSSPDGGYLLHDPASGERVPVTPDVAAGLSRQGYTFYVTAPPGALNARILGRLLGREVWPDVRRVLGFVAAGAALGLGLPVVTGLMFNRVIPSASMANAVTLVAALLALVVATAAVDIARAFALIRVETRTNGLLQAAVVDRLLALPPQFFRAYSVGDLALRAAAVNAARQVLTSLALTSLFGGALVITSVSLMAWYSLKLALAACGILAGSALVTTLVGLYALPHERRRQMLHGSISTLVFEMLSGVAKLHVAAAERRMFALWGAQFRAQKVAAFRAGAAAAALASFNALLPIFAAGIVFVVAARVFAAAGGLTTGDFIAFLTAFASALAAGIGVSTTIVSLLNVIPLVERAAPILSTAPEVDDARPDIGTISGRIEMSHLTFGYTAGTAPVLDDVSFETRPGEFVAVVGPSGGGKSTMLRLLLGFEKPDRGAVYFDGYDLASVDVASVRRQCSVVLQHSKLLAGDLFTNIVGASPLTLDDAWRAADLAGLADDISAMPMGMYTVISEGGSTLSGGQRQRLLIARALVRRPRIVFFDEATSALDNRSQDIVTRSLERMQATRIVIAHRLTTVQRADRILVVAKGRIVQQGRYDDLITTDGLFKDLAQRQLV